MLQFLSPAWLAALDDAARRSESLAAAGVGRRLVIEQHITGTPEGEVVFHVTLDDGSASVEAGPADDPTVRFEQDLATARAIASGRGSAQRAFMAGELRVGGDLRILLDQQDLLAGLDDVFRTVREQTDLAPVAGDA